MPDSLDSEKLVPTQLNSLCAEEVFAAFGPFPEYIILFVTGPVEEKIKRKSGTVPWCRLM